MTDEKDEGGKLLVFPKKEEEPAETTKVTVRWDGSDGRLALEFEQSVKHCAIIPEDAERVAKSLLSLLQFQEQPFHRDAPRLPISAEDRKKEIAWVMDHPIWTYPVAVRMPPTKGGTSGEPDENGNCPVLMDGPDWEEQTYQIGGGFYESVQIEIAYVDPSTESIRNASEGWADPRNTASRVWIEAGTWLDQSEDPHFMVPDEGWDDRNKWLLAHDPNLYCGGPDMETALLELARNVRFFYNDDGTERGGSPRQCEGHFPKDKEATSVNWVSACEDSGDGFCKHCGFLIGEDDPDDDDE